MGLTRFRILPQQLTYSIIQVCRRYLNGAAIGQVLDVYFIEADIEQAMLLT
jgi:hypothetical protein